MGFYRKYNDSSSRGQYELALNESFSAEQALDFVHFFSRDNARTPMQWNADANAGFTSGQAWLPIYDDYTFLNYFRKLNAFTAKDTTYLCHESDGSWILREAKEQATINENIDKDINLS